MAGDRQSVPLQDLVEADGPITYGVVQPGPHDPDGVRFIRGGDVVDGRVLDGQLRTISREVSEQYSRTLLRGGELLVSLVGNPGAVALVPPRLAGANIARQVGLVRLRHDIDARYVMYFLASGEGKAALGAQTMGSVQQVINLRDLKNVRVPLPPLTEQRAIVRVLGALDDKIELNRRTNETLQAMARVLFKSWFVDFDPVRAKTEGGAPAGMDAATAALFPDGFDSSVLGDMPRGWRVCPVGEAVRAVGGGTPSTSEASYWNGPYCWVRPKDLSALGAPVLLRTERTITKAGLAGVSSGLLPVGTVLLSSRAPIGYLAVSAVSVAVNQGFIAMVCDGDVPNHYVLHWCVENMSAIEARAGGTTFPEISKKSFRPIPMMVPAKPVLDAWERMAEPIYDRIASNLRESDTIVALRDALLPRLLSGELRLRDAEKAVEQVA